MIRRAATLTLALIGLLVVGTTRAQAGPLLAQNWRELGPKERYDTMQNYWRHQQLPQDRQRDIEKRYERWQGMSPDEPARVRQNYERYRQLGAYVRARLRQLGLSPLADEDCAAPVITTFAPPADELEKIVEQLESGVQRRAARRLLGRARPLGGRDPGPGRCADRRGGARESS